MITFLVLVGSGIFCKLANTTIKFNNIILFTVIADTCLTVYFLHLYFRG